MTVQEAIKTRHSVRAYKEQPLTEGIVKSLENLGIAKCHFEIGAGKDKFDWV